ncbi:hypothetical protein IPC436_26705 [Pseudomonas aeruginosa]|nr:hypothetical protein IPC436_26705 [Pseudomonas aeruginosa]
MAGLVLWRLPPRRASSPRRMPVGEPIFRLFRHGWRRAKTLFLPVEGLLSRPLSASATGPACHPRLSKRQPKPILGLAGERAVEPA